MGKFYWGFVGVVVALFIYAGATGNFGIIPNLPFDLPFSRQAQPTANVLNAPLIYPQMTAPSASARRSSSNALSFSTAKSLGIAQTITAVGSCATRSLSS